MGPSDDAFVSHWRVDGTVTEVNAVLSAPASLTRRWPAVFLEVRVLAPGDARGVGRTVELLTQGDARPWECARRRPRCRSTRSRGSPAARTCAPRGR